MEISRTLTVRSRSQWRSWLRKNHQKSKDIWLVYFKKGTGKENVSYNDAVEEALCFGWIDSIVKSIDSEKYVQRFSPRNPKTPYSQPNKERLKKLISEKKVIPEVLAKVKSLRDESKVSVDILSEIKKNKDAWRNFKKFSRSYIRIRVGFIEGARKRPDEFKKRLAYFVKMTAENKQFGHGGVSKYY